MELLTKHLTKINIPKPTDKVYKDECLFSFDNPETETGLYVSLTNFYGFGRDYVELCYRKSGHSVFLHIRQERRMGDGPEKKITRLAIGVEGGFDPDSGCKKFELINHYNVVVLPALIAIPWPNGDLPEQVRASVQGILDAPSAGKVAELESLTGTWDGEQRITTVHGADLKQQPNTGTGKRIPAGGGWQCERCDKRDNLWLNLSDGSILCGRKFHDGTGGNNHALEHYEQTKYPLAVKLGTITKDGKADVFSYAEDDMVDDPKLIEHLAHWGINIATMEKSEKSMVELELDLNQRFGEWATLQESSGGKLTPIYGAGYTGMVNLGNSCYLNSVMQMLFIVPDFIRRYYQNATSIFEKYSHDPANDFNTQMAKLGVGLLSGKYSNDPGVEMMKEEEEEKDIVTVSLPGISPHMFKTLIGRGHGEFSTKRQQDAQEFLSYMMTLLERNNHHFDQFDPAISFKFKLEERVQCCASKKVKYTYRSDWLLPLNIPLEAVLNKQQVSAYEARRKAAEAEGRKLTADQLVRPRIQLFSCLEAFTQSELIEQFYSTAVKDKTQATKTSRLSTFPDYLLIQLKKFTLREDWMPIKLDVAVDMPDVLDLSSLRGTGLQTEEQQLPELVGSPPPVPTMDQGVLDQLQDMGFPSDACKRAIFFTQNAGLEQATAWIMEHISDADFAEPFIPPGTDSIFTPDSNALQFIMAMGFTRDQAIRALKATDNNAERAADWVFSHQDELNTAAASTLPPPPPPPPLSEFRDGNGKYRLIAFISHMGPSSMVGHYVCHIWRQGHWVIYNDSKVCLSENPPKDLGYIYLYERM